MGKFESIHRNIALLAWFNFFCDFRLYAPFAILYFSKVAGSFAAGMSIFSIVMLSQAVFEIPTGIFSDFIGRKKTMFIGAVLSTTAVVCYALGGTYWLLIIGALLEGIGRSFYSGNNDALLMDTLKEELIADKYPEYNGKISTPFQIALGISGMLGGAFVLISSLNIVLWLSVLPQLASLVISLFVKEPKNLARHKGNIYAHLKESLKLFWNNHQLQQMSVIHALSYALGESGYQFRAAFISQFWPVWAVGFVATLANIGAAFSFWISGSVINRFRALPVLVATGVYDRISTLLALLFPSWISPLLMSSSSLNFGVESVAEDSILQHEYTDQERATMGSVTSVLGSGLFALTAVLLGFAADLLGTQYALLVLQIPLLLVLLMTWRLYRNNHINVAS